MLVKINGKSTNMDLSLCSSLFSLGEMFHFTSVKQYYIFIGFRFKFDIEISYVIKNWHL